ncbi:murein L,D-transpeptidase catalytic domain family protein [bacterium SCSIO 12741]|nr:murein L,D-transpeptidase catalytic domain family protein [bacterium SCSIO 12741]
MIRTLLGVAVLFLLGSFQPSEESRPEIRSQKGLEALTFAQENGMNTDFCILIDMGIHSGKKRLFVWNLESQSADQSGMVSHGSCEHPWSGTETKENPIFSNVPESHCSSLGKYKIGKRGYSQWGIHVNYKLHGLESSNNKAYSRIIVLHSWEAVSNDEVYPEGTPEGWGCPAVANDFMRKLDHLISSSDKPVLMWIYN